MSSKLDPALRALLDDAPRDADREVVLLLGLARPADDATLAELGARGLRLRSTIGDVLTGTAPLGKVLAIAEHPAVVKIEASGPLQPESSRPPMPG
jgi:hypothetical protein